MLSGDDGQSWTLAGTSTNTSYTVGNLSFNQDYLVYVRVVNTGGSVTASTNRVNFEITSDESQDFTYLRSVSVIDNEYIRVRALTSGDTLPFVSITKRWGFVRKASSASTTSIRESLRTL